MHVLLHYTIINWLISVVTVNNSVPLPENSADNVCCWFLPAPDSPWLTPGKIGEDCVICYMAVPLTGCVL